MAINRINDVDVKIYLKISFLSEFHVNIITGFGVTGFIKLGTRFAKCQNVIKVKPTGEEREVVKLSPTQIRVK